MTFEGRGFHAITAVQRGSSFPIRADAIVFEASGFAGGASGAAVVDGNGKVIGVVSSNANEDTRWCRAISRAEIGYMLGQEVLNGRGAPRSLVGRWVCTLNGKPQEIAFQFSADRKFELMLHKQLIVGHYRVGKKQSLPYSAEENRYRYYRVAGR